MKRNLLSVVGAGAMLLGALASSAWADLKVVQEVTIKGMPEAAKQGNPDIEKPQTTTTYYKGDRVRSEQKAGVTITDYKEDKMWTLDTKKKTFYVTKISEAMNAAANNPMMEMFKMDIKADVKPGTETKEILGRSAKNVNYSATFLFSMKDGSESPLLAMMPTITIKGEQWVTDSIKVPGDPKQMLQRMNMRGPMAMFGGSMKEFVEKMASIPGYPLMNNMTMEFVFPPSAPPQATQMFGDKPMMTMVEVKSVSEDALDDALFTVPEDYKEVKAPQPGFPGAPGGPQ
jgi:hypothetical protein